MLKKKSRTSVFFSRLGKILFVLLIIGITIFALRFSVNSFKDLEHYRRVHNSAITVTATVTNVESYTDSDGYTDYDSYVTYEVDGVRYENVHYSDNKLSYGEKFQIKVSPEDPGMPLNTLKNSNALALSGCIILFATAVCIYNYAVKSRRSKSQYGTPESEVICKDIQLTVIGRFWRPFSLLISLIMLFLILRYPSFSDMWIYFEIGIAAFWLYTLYSAIRDYRCAQRGEFEVRRDVLFKKKIVSDSDGVDTYRLYYKSNEKTWSTSVSESNYDVAEKGDIVIAVYLPHSKRPIIHYDRHGEVTE